jgi:Flp pilus assembly protein TadG
MSKAQRPGADLLTNDKAVAAVEFGLILPLMLVIYMGLVELSRGMRAAQKLDLVAHTLSDLTAQTLIGGQNINQAGLSESDISAIFTAANMLMTPLPTTTLKMTITEINITSPSTGVWQATPTWSVTRNGGPLRPCQPMQPGDVPPVSSNTLPPSYILPVNGVNPSAGYIIVADVVYDYSPGLHFEMFKWNSSPTYTMKRTSYSAVRNTYVPPHIQYLMTSGTNCNAPTP